MSGEGLLIVVPARGGSKGIPRKNALRLGGIPLLGWTAEAVTESGLTGATCVLSTDDPQIADIGRSVGLEVPFMRPPEIATDTASVLSVVLHALEWFEKERGQSYEAVMLLQPTSPFRPPWALVDACRRLGESSCDGMIGVKPVRRSLSTLFVQDRGWGLQPLEEAPEQNARRQDVRTLYTPNGAMYLVRTQALRAQQTFFPRRLEGLAMDKIASIDIDDAVDWKLAEAIAAAGVSWRG